MNDKCKCSLSISLCGDGCRYCQPQEYIERLHETLAEERIEYEQMEKQVTAQQARIDELMLEYCPEEMTQEQLENWGKHQRPVVDAK